MTAKAIDGFESENQAFEDWLKTKCEVDKDALKLKREKMAKDPFPFLRATYFRWASTVERLCPELRKAPRVLAVGDIHIENFGTWRNVDQRLVWGINDFDEAARMPYPFDLVRLITSARLVPKMTMDPKDIAAAVLEGYRQGVHDPRPTLLDQEQQWMNAFLRTKKKKRKQFKETYKNLVSERVSMPARRGLTEAFPKGVRPTVFSKRTTGAGSLGRPRFVAAATWLDGFVVREAKAQVPSAWDWTHGRPDAPSMLIEAARSEHRSPDPNLTADGRFVYRRLAADADKIELDDLKERDVLQASLFEAMGFDLGSFHARSPRAAEAISKDLSHHRGSWLHHAADRMEDQVRYDHEKWQEVMGVKKPKSEKKR